MSGFIIKQLELKIVPNAITHMVWSDRMDLVALANVKGEVSLQRFAWTKAWSINAPKEGLTVNAMCWRPDGKIIAIAYSSGDVLLVKVENVEIVLSLQMEKDISCLYWTQEKHETTTKDDEEENEYVQYIDFSNKFLMDPQSQTFDASEQSNEEQKNILQTSELNLFVIGTTSGRVQISVFGCFPCLSIDLNKINLNQDGPCSVENLHLTEDLSQIYVTTKDSANNVNIVIIDSGLFKTHTKELYAVALKNVKIMSLINYISSSIDAIKETWESILLEMDHKLSKYASKVAEGGVTADFLDLLMFGICSNEMEEFLVADLTKKGLEKFGQTIEMSYANIHKLLIKYVLKYGQNITYHLSELRGMARFEHRYKPLGIMENLITEGIRVNGAFLIKADEMQQIINQSIINYQAFFRWLFSAIMLLMDEQINSDIPKMTQQDLAYITEFLQNFDYIGEKTDDKKQSGFRMERLGQYLSDSPLTIEPNMEGNEWTKFLAENQCLKEHTSILKHNEKMSLIQQFNELTLNIDNIFKNPNKIITEQFNILKNLNVFNCKDNLKSTQFNLDNNSVLLAFRIPMDEIILVHIQKDIIKGGILYFSQIDNTDNNYLILDVKFYSSSVLSILLQENNSNKTSVLYQFLLGNILDYLTDIGGTDKICENLPKINGSEFSPKIYKVIEGMTALQFAVSGRKLGIVLSENRRKVRLFEMEREDEDDEDTDMNVTDNEMSVQEENASNFFVNINP